MIIRLTYQQPLFHLKIIYIFLCSLIIFLSFQQMLKHSIFIDRAKKSEMPRAQPYNVSYDHNFSVNLVCFLRRCNQALGQSPGYLGCSSAIALHTARRITLLEYGQSQARPNGLASKPPHLQGPKKFVSNGDKYFATWCHANNVATCIPTNHVL